MIDRTNPQRRTNRAKKLHIIIPHLRHPNRDKYAIHNRKQGGCHHA